MSTLMSTDMNLDRSSTRVHAPPGGRSSISFGYEPEEPSRKTTAQAAPLNVFSMPTSVPTQNKGHASDSNMSNLLGCGEAAAPVSARRGGNNHPQSSLGDVLSQSASGVAVNNHRQQHTNSLSSNMNGVMGGEPVASAAPTNNHRQQHTNSLSSNMNGVMGGEPVASAAPTNSHRQQHANNMSSNMSSVMGGDPAADAAYRAQCAAEHNAKQTNRNASDIFNQTPTKAKDTPSKPQSLSELVNKQQSANGYAQANTQSNEILSSRRGSRQAPGGASSLVIG